MAKSRLFDRTRQRRTVRFASLLLGLLWVQSTTAQQVSSPVANPAGSATRAEQALRANDTAGAIREYRAMIAAHPDDSQAWTSLGVLLYGFGHAAEAADALRQALHWNPLVPRAELFLALSEADTQQCPQALPNLKKYFAGEPQGKLQRLIGLTLLQCSAAETDASSALQTAAKLEETYPSDPDVLYELAELYTRMWTETADQLLTAHPESYRVHQLAAEVSEAQGNLPRAISEYRAALDENAALPQMHYRLGQLLLRAGDTDADDKAMAEFRAELVINPQSAFSFLAMAEIERHQGKLAEASADYGKAIGLEPDLVAARVGLAQTLLAEHQLGAAISQLQTLLASHPESAQAHYAMMLAYRQQGRLQEASNEMSSFQKLQRGSASTFEERLHALLSGNRPSTEPAATTGSQP